MKIELGKLELEGAERDFDFSPGINLISGPTSTGKTTLINCIRGVLGNDLDGMSTEARKTIRNLNANLKLGENEFQIVRPFKTTNTAKVSIAGNYDTWRIPAMSHDRVSDITYGQWLMEKLELPKFRVPKAPTKDLSEMSPVSINDYMIYAHLKQKEIMTSIMGHINHYKNVKRKAVFEITYGIYGEEQAKLEEQRRELVRKLLYLENRSETIEDLFDGTAFENIAMLRQKLNETEEELQEMKKIGKERADQISEKYKTENLRNELRHVAEAVDEVQGNIHFHQNSAKQKKELKAQLETKIKQLTKSLLAGDLLIDFDFVVCPRCGADIENRELENETACYLCLQSPHEQEENNTDEFEKEINRIERQVAETMELIENHYEQIEYLEKDRIELLEKKNKLEEKINYKLDSYISEKAEKISNIAEKRSELTQKISKYKEYLGLYEQLQDTQEKISEFKIKIENIEQKINAINENSQDFSKIFQFLNEKYREYIKFLEAPEFKLKGETYIDDQTLRPVYQGKRIGGNSPPGLIVLTNIAQFLAHQVTSLEFKLNLPNILLADGVSGPLGAGQPQDEYLDPERILAIYKLFTEISKNYDLQVFLADNYIPEGVGADYKIEFTEHNRLIPEHLL